MCVCVWNSACLTITTLTTGAMVNILIVKHALLTTIHTCIHSCKITPITIRWQSLNTAIRTFRTSYETIIKLILRRVHYHILFCCIFLGVCSILGWPKIDNQQGVLGGRHSFCYYFACFCYYFCTLCTLTCTLRVLHVLHVVLRT